MIIKPQKEYELIDSGDEMKLERYGNITVARPDPQAIWNKGQDNSVWDKADATYVKSSRNPKFHDLPVRGEKIDEAESGAEGGRWNIAAGSQSKFKNLDDKTQGTLINLGSIKIYMRLTPFKHTAIFPEQLENWNWAESIIKNAKSKPRVLNLFGYTGGASVVCAKAGADVTHVDASRAAVTWAKENMLATGLGEQSIRWMLEDAVVFVKKEIKRGNKYDGIIMDPPVFGRGAKGEVWKIERDLVPLLEMCYELLSESPIFFILNGYASGYSAVAYANNLQALVSKFGGSVEHGELLIEESASKPERYLPCGIVARWKAE